MFEQLESRRMMSATIERGVLSVRGTNFADTITIDQQGNWITVTENGESTRFAADSVRRIVVNAMGGDDQVFVLRNHSGTVARVKPPMQVFGGFGDDVLRGGGGRDQLHGEAGNDSLYGADGNDVLRGGSGDDETDGGFGNDVAFGDAGEDFLSDTRGSDTIYGGLGNDRASTKDFGLGGADFINAGGQSGDKAFGSRDDVVVGAPARSFPEFDATDVTVPDPFAVVGG